MKDLIRISTTLLATDIVHVRAPKRFFTKRSNVRALVFHFGSSCYASDQRYEPRDLSNARLEATCIRGTKFEFPSVKT